MASICRACDQENVEKFISFGKIPMGNAFLKEEQLEEEEQFDLDIGFCINCKFVQQINPPPTRVIVEDYKNYSYVPFGNSLTGNLKDLGNSIVKEFSLNKDSLFVDIGSNDGTMLSAIKDKCRAVGVEPAINISKISKDRGVNTINDFFTSDVANNIIRDYGNADVVTVTQVLQHIPDISAFVKNVYKLLKEDGVFVIEGRYFTDTLRKRSYDTIYNEMLYFFTLTSIDNMLRRFDMKIFKAELVEVYGGSLRVYATKSKINSNKSVSDILAQEKDLNIHQLESYKDFANDAFRLKNELTELIKDLKADGKRIVGYGAPSTSATLLNFCNITNHEIDYVVDDSPLKQGLYTPGTHIPIVDSSMLEREKPDYILLLAWRLKNEIIPKLEKYQAKIIIPLPYIEILD